MLGSLRLFSSPRRRRRVVRAAAFLLVAGAVAFGITRLTLNPSVEQKETFRAGRPVVTGNEKPVRLTKSDRRLIGATLARFVQDGVTGRDPAAVYDLVTPQFRGGTTRAQWRSGAAPVYSYPARTGGIAGQWRVNYAYRGEVGVALMLDSRYPKKVGQIIVHAELRERRGHWLVDSFAPVATFTPIGQGPQHETGPADYTGAANTAEARAEKAPLSVLWIVVPASVLGLALLIPLCFVVGARVRERRALRAYDAMLPKTLPPLPVRRD